MSRRAKWIVAAVVLLVAAGPVGAWVYFNVIAEDAPERLTIDDGEPAGADVLAAAAPAAAGDISGTWKPSPRTVRA